MANKNLFKTLAGALLPKTNVRNEAGGVAYKLSPKAALAQYVMTGCLNGTFYADADTQLAMVLELCGLVEPDFIAKLAVFARERGFMKDLPALLVAVLAVRDKALFDAAFDRVIDNGKMLRNFVQILRSGVVGRKSLGSLPKRKVRDWFTSRTPESVFRASVGQSPSLADIVKMVHPKPDSKEREALYGYLIGRKYEHRLLPELVRKYESFKAGNRDEVPNVPHEMLTALELRKKDWGAIARNAGWQMTRMNLNTFARHGVFELPGMAEFVAAKLRNEAEIAKARVFPYQLLNAYTNAGGDIPGIVRDALQDAMETAIGNVPEFGGKVYVFPDVSGSMHSPVTGYRQGSTSKVRCIDVAALVAASVLRKNRNAEVIPFETNIVKVELNPRDSVMTNATKLANLPAGGTNCSAPLAELNRRNASGDLVIYVSDNESWVDTPHHGRFGGNATETMKQWAAFKKRNANAKLVCIDIQPYATTQAAEREDILNIGGFSDQVFNVIAAFAKNELNADHWIGVIEAVTL